MLVQPMAPDKPEYRVYRARRGILSRLLNRRDSARFDTLPREGEAGPAPRNGGVPGTVEPPRRTLPRRPAGAPPSERKPISWKRVLAYVGAAIAAWTLL